MKECIHNPKYYEIQYKYQKRSLGIYLLQMTYCKKCKKYIKIIAKPAKSNKPNK